MRGGNADEASILEVHNAVGRDLHSLASHAQVRPGSNHDAVAIDGDLRWDRRSAWKLDGPARCVRHCGQHVVRRRRVSTCRDSPHVPLASDIGEVDGCRSSGCGNGGGGGGHCARSVYGGVFLLGASGENRSAAADRDAGGAVQREHKTPVSGDGPPSLGVVSSHTNVRPARACGKMPGCQARCPRARLLFRANAQTPRPAIRMPRMVQPTGPRNWWILVKFAPSILPATASTAHQARVPMKFASRKSPIFMCATPAGMDINPRTPGTIWAMITSAKLLPEKRAVARSRSFARRSVHRPYRSTHFSGRSSPSARPAKYNGRAPSTEPMVPAKMTPVRPSWPFAVSNPASGMISSDGRGRKMFSIAMRMATPQ